jgi:mannose-6-phosphate isomerase-like protein (cupin superfamily)
MLIKKSQAKKKANSDQCTVWEYDSPSENVSFATAYIDGRYPDKGMVANMECEEIYYVLGGSGIIHSEFGDFNIEEGDIYHFKKGEKYWSEGKELKLVLVNTPKWSPEQMELTK